jgi:protein-S-isoprenylcysteine O-methyltransferase Ste14
VASVGAAVVVVVVGFVGIVAPGDGAVVSVDEETGAVVVAVGVVVCVSALAVLTWVHSSARTSSKMSADRDLIVSGLIGESISYRAGS